jgi:hypothetical protein
MILIKERKEGQILSSWYLPIRKYSNKYAYEEAFFLVAPFVLMYRIISECLWHIWRSLNETLDLLISYRKKK